MTAMLERAADALRDQPGPLTLDAPTVAILAACAWAGWAALGPWLITLIGQLDDRPRPPRPQDHPCAWAGCSHSGWIAVHHVHGYDARVCADHHLDGQRLGMWTS